MCIIHVVHIVSISNNSQDANLRNYCKLISSTFLAPSLLLAEFHIQCDELQPGSAFHQIIALCCHTRLQWNQCNLSLEPGKRVSSLTHLLSSVMATFLCLGNMVRGIISRMRCVRRVSAAPDSTCSHPCTSLFVHVCVATGWTTLERRSIWKYKPTTAETFSLFFPHLNQTTNLFFHATVQTVPPAQQRGKKLGTGSRIWTRR